MTSYVERAPPTYTLVLLKVGPKPIWVMKEIRRLLNGTSLVDVRRMLECPPVILKSRLCRHDADSIAYDFREAGATMKLVEHQSDEWVPFGSGRY